jgi:hypothetical protein
MSLPQSETYDSALSGAIPCLESRYTCQELITFPASHETHSLTDTK